MMSEDRSLDEPTNHIPERSLAETQSPTACFVCTCSSLLTLAVGLLFLGCLNAATLPSLPHLFFDINFRTNIATLVQSESAHWARFRVPRSATCDPWGEGRRGVLVAEAAEENPEDVPVLSCFIIDI